MKKRIVLIVLLVLVTGCKNVENQNTESAGDEELEELFSLMQGSFNSEKQAKADSAYYNISLHMYPIWKEKGRFLYVEQALASMQEKPYRQRVYEVKRLNDSIFTSAVYTIDNDSIWAGKWKTPKAFDSLSPDDIILKDGCEVLLRRLKENHFKGKTGQSTCASSLRGASFARSEVEIYKDKIISWDRGFDHEGNYVWGAEKGGYIFEKIN
jgi:hypothetical protein